MYGVAEYMMMLQEVEKARLARQQVQEIDQNERTCQPPDEEWATKEEERDG